VLGYSAGKGRLHALGEWPVCWSNIDGDLLIDGLEKEQEKRAWVSYANPERSEVCCCLHVCRL
jgi:hypothetical protein